MKGPFSANSTALTQPQSRSRNGLDADTLHSGTYCSAKRLLTVSRLLADSIFHLSDRKNRGSRALLLLSKGIYSVCCAQRAIKAGVTSSLQVYASAIGACKSSRSADLDAALQVYSDMQRCAAIAQWRLRLKGTRERTCRTTS